MRGKPLYCPVFDQCADEFHREGGQVAAAEPAVSRLCFLGTTFFHFAASVDSRKSDS